MQKRRSYFTVVSFLMLALLLLTGCQVSGLGELESQVLEVEKVEELVSTRNYPMSKTETDYIIITQTLYGREVVSYLGNPGPSYNSKSYNDGIYSGTLNKVGYTILSTTNLPNDRYEFRVKLRYSGTVTQIGKEVTAYRDATQRLYDYEIVSKLGNLGSSYDRYYYSKDGYRGYITKRYYQNISSKQLSGNFWEFKIRFVYKGRVYKY